MLTFVKKSNNSIMKKIQTSILFLLATTFMIAQGFQGQATYVSKRVLTDILFDSSVKSTSGGMSSEMQKQLQEQMKKAFEKTYILDFNATESSFLKEATLAAPAVNKSGMSFSMTLSGEDSPLYKNIKTKQYLQERENYRVQTNLITDNLTVYDWKIEGETKKIGGYDCYKAVTIIKVTLKQMEDYIARKLKESKRKTVLYPAKEPKDKIVEAWFTNDIPVGHGPAEFWGLPGLILELTQGNTTYLCSKIVLNPKDKKTIAVPKKGKVISQTDFDAAEKKYFDKMANENGVIIRTETSDFKN